MENQSKDIVSIPKEMRVLADITLVSEERQNKGKRKHSEMTEDDRKSENNPNRPDDICQKKQKCGFCQQTFFENKNLLKHIKRLHPDDMKINNTISEKPPQESCINIDSKKETFKDLLEVKNQKMKSYNDDVTPTTSQKKEECVEKKQFIRIEVGNFEKANFHKRLSTTFQKKVL